MTSIIILLREDRVSHRSVMKNADAKVCFLELFMTLNNGSKLDLNHHSSGEHSPGARNKADWNGKEKLPTENRLPPEEKRGTQFFRDIKPEQYRSTAKEVHQDRGKHGSSRESNPPNFKALILMPVTEKPMKTIG